MKRVPIQAAKDVAKKFGMAQTILVLQEPSGYQHVVTYGKSYANCVEAARKGNWIKASILNWPLSLCDAKPARQIRKEKEALCQKKSR
jgi:hypothetical protein